MGLRASGLTLTATTRDTSAVASAGENSEQKQRTGEMEVGGRQQLWMMMVVWWCHVGLGLVVVKLLFLGWVVIMFLSCCVVMLFSGLVVVVVCVIVMLCCCSVVMFGCGVFGLLS